MLKSFLVILTIGFVLHHLAQLFLAFDPIRVVFSHAPGPCQAVPNINHGSEDMEVLRTHRLAFVTSGMKSYFHFSNPNFNDRKGKIFLVNLDKPDDKAYDIPIITKQASDFTVDKFVPHGISSWEDGGKLYLFVVHHTETRSSVERFEYDFKGKKLTHLNSFTSDAFSLLNGILATGPKSFYFTNFASFRNPILLNLELYLMLARGSVGYYSNGQGKPVVQKLMGPNGIAMSKDKKYIFVLTTVPKVIKVFKLGKKSAEPEFSHDLALNIICDNLDVDEDGNIWTGCHANGVKLMDHSKDTKNLSPSTIIKVTVDAEAKLKGLTEVYADDGSKLSAAASGFYDKKSNSLLIGSIHTKLMICHPKYLN